MFQISPTAQRIRENSRRPAGGSPAPGTVSLALGEPDFDTPAPIVEAMTRALAQGVTHYGDLNGDAQLRDLIASRAPASAITADQVSITHGASAALASAIHALVGPGDRIVIPEPTYSLYFDLALFAGAQTVPVPNTVDGQLDVDAIIEAARGSRLVILCNPGNPTGVVLTAESLAEVGRRLAGTDTLVLVDEAYSDIVYTSEFTSALTIPELADRLVLVHTFSKTYAMTGWRLGYSIAPQPVAQEISRLHRTYNGAPNSAIQRAGIVALTECESHVALMREEYALRRTYVLDRLNAMDAVEVMNPGGAFYAFVRHHVGLSSAEVRAELAAAGVLTRQGDEYGPSGEGWIRLSFAASFADLDLGLTRVETCLAELRDRHGEEL